MKKAWTEPKAVKFLKDRDIEFMGKRIVAKDGYNGLISCSARDFLINHCGYKQI